ncbi:MAG: copper amine oxidase N-terminal domain-containing protein [Eubacteriales bacterium]
MRKRIFSIVISFIMILSLSIAPAFGETNVWSTEEKDEIIKEAELEIERYIRSKAEEVKLTTSDEFQENLRETKKMITCCFDYNQFNETLAFFLNESLEETDEEVLMQLISYAQDYNSSRSNKRKTESREDDMDDEEESDDSQEKALDYNSSRSNKPRTEAYIGDDYHDEDSDDDGISDGMEIDFITPIDNNNLILIDNISLAEIKLNSSNNADLVLAMTFVNSIQKSIEDSGMVNRCDLENNKIAFYFQNQDGMNTMYLKEKFFIPLVREDSGDCDDTDPEIKPGEEDPDFNDGDSDGDGIDDGIEDSKLIFKIGDENVLSGNIRKVLEVPPFIENNRTMVPFRFIGEELGAEIKWNPEERKVEYKLGDNLIELWIGENTARLNGEDIILDEDPSIRPFIENSRTVVPIRFISEALGFEVIWNEETKEIMIEGNPLYEAEEVEGENPLYNE